MIKSYKHSWQIYVREHFDLGSQKRWNGLSVVTQFQEFMHKRSFESRIWDIGCGQNIIKEYYEHLFIYGIDKSWEADQYAHLEDSDIMDCRVDDAFAINSLHFGTVDDIKRRVNHVMDCLSPNGTFFLTLNNFLTEEEFKVFANPDFWREFGYLLDLYHADEDYCENQKLDMWHELGDYVSEDDKQKIYTDAIKSDALWGRCRVTLRK